MSDSFKPPPDDCKASIVLSIECIVFLFILPVLLLDRYSHKQSRSREGKRTHFLMIVVVISNAIFQITNILRSTTCLTSCNAIMVAFINSRVVLKGINLIFLIHRAKLVQGMAPILSKKWFEKIIPSIVILLDLVLIVLMTRIALGTEYHCAMHTDSNSVHFCWKKQKYEDSGKTSIWFMILLDIVITAFLLTLFVVPLYRVYRQDLGVLNENQLRQRMKLKGLLI